MLHHFAQSISHIVLPEQFTYPFYYTPHPLCKLAAQEVQAYLASQKEWKEELQQGKMFGVLIVQTSKSEVGYLAAFSGNLAGKNRHPFFVPPIYDLLQPDGFFKVEEKNISAINIQIKSIQQDNRYKELLQQMAYTKMLEEQALSKAKADLKEAKKMREIRRLKETNAKEQADMIRESQFQKAEFKRLERHWREQITGLQTKIDHFTSQIETLKTERKVRSAALQQKLFEQFRILNARGEIKDLCAIFEQTKQKTPPAGAGECAAPKLLQYAYRNQLRPVAMAEFWWGNSPKTEIRHHGYYYPACKGKCEPILTHMLQGLDVEKNPLLENLSSQPEFEILYEDAWLLVINKPAGILSVPGKTEAESVYSRLKKKYPDATGPMVVHRLDMATSGLLLIAKTKEVHQNLQDQFENRTIKKRYVAMLDGILTNEEGVIDLPLCADLIDRPRQIVSEPYGKQAITRYKVIKQTGHQTRIAFYPITGRTHQLRVHAAHPQGLNCPIAGDPLYGKKDKRLYLHAEYLEFRHPISGKVICIEKEAEF